jgi:hypothetical protein
MNARIRNASLVLLLLTATAGGTKAQYAWDFGIHLGGANYLGEMGGKEDPRKDFIWDLKLNQTRWCVGGFARRKINRMISLNTGLLFFRIQGADINSQNPQRVGRNLNFRNNMLEWYLRGEFTIFQDNDLGGRGRYRTDFRLFGYAGAALFLHNPRGEYTGATTGDLSNGDVVSLRPLKTEHVEYSSLGFAIPVGIGFHFTKHRRHRFGWDFGWRTTFTDYLDDASTLYVDPIVPGDGDNAVRELMYDQFDPVDIDPLTPGHQVESSNGDIVTTPDKYQYGYWDTDGPSEPSKNKRGDPTHNDSYLTMTFTYSYVLKGQSNFYRQRYSWMRGKKRIGRKSRAKF